MRKKRVNKRKPHTEEEIMNSYLMSEEERRERLGLEEGEDTYYYQPRREEG